MLVGIYPSSYVKELKAKGERDKAVAFMDYWDDCQTNNHNYLEYQKH